MIENDMTIARISIDNCSGDAAEGKASAAMMITIDATNLIVFLFKISYCEAIVHWYSDSRYYQ
jgi:hypothetical protein